MSEQVASRRPAVTRWCAVGVVSATGLIAYLAYCRLRLFPYPLDVVAAWHGAREVLDRTGPAAVETWTILALPIAALARMLDGRDAGWSITDRLIGAIVVLWTIAYVSLLALGPIGLFTPTTLRLVAAGVVVAGVLRPARRFVRRRWTAGGWVAALAVALAIGPLLLLQLASPVSPFMDVLGYIAPVQKIVTFRFYDPYANDPAGLWASTREVVGFDAFFAFVALVTGLPAHLAMTAVIVPFAIFQLLALYRICATAAGRLAGGMAALFVLQTFLWRRTTDVRSTGVAFALVAVGLAFMLTPRRDARKLALGCLALGIALTVNPLIGAVGMQVAAVATVVRFLDLRRPLVAPIVGLASACLLALPQVCVSVALQPPRFVLPLAALLGLAGLAALAARRTPPTASAETSGDAAHTYRGPFAAPTRLLVIVSLPVAMLWIHASRRSELASDTWFGYGFLMLLALGGIAAAGRHVFARPRVLAAAAIPAIALWIGIVDHEIASPLRFGGALETRSVASEVTTKMVYYWSPYWLAAAAGTWFALLGRRWALGPALVLALVLVVYPLCEIPRPLDYDTQQMSLAETWGFHLANAARGYHAGRPDRRWVLDAKWRELAHILENEIAAGRLGYYDHVVEISPSIDTFELALWTGISVDVFTPSYDPQSIWTGNGRARGLDALPRALASRPRWVIVEYMAAAQFPELASYEAVFSRDGLQLYRAR